MRRILSLYLRARARKLPSIVHRRQIFKALSSTSRAYIIPADKFDTSSADFLPLSKLTVVDLRSSFFLGSMVAFQVALFSGMVEPCLFNAGVIGRPPVCSVCSPHRGTRRAMIHASDESAPRKRAKYLALIAIVLLSYFLAGKVGQATIAIRSGNIGPVWPAFGVALGAVLLFGYRVWPGIFLGVFLVDFLSPVP